MRGLPRPQTWSFYWAAAVACSGPRPAVNSPPPAPPAPATAPKIPPPPPPASVPPDVDYRQALVSALQGTFRGRVVDAGRPDFVVLRQRGLKKRDIVVTAGLGRAPRQTGDPHVELVAHVPAYAPGVSEVLTALAARIESLKAYEAVELPQAVRTLKYFDLFPGAEVSILGATVRLYRVVPLTAEEFEDATESEGSQWVGGELAEPGAAIRTLERWVPALEK